MMRNTQFVVMLAVSLAVTLALVVLVLWVWLPGEPLTATADPPPESLSAGPVAERGSSHTEFIVQSDIGPFQATIDIVGAGAVAPDDAALRAVAKEFARRVGLSTDKPTTPPSMTHAQAVADLARSADESPGDLSHPPWLAAALAVFPVHLQPSFHAIGCAESGLTADAVGPPNYNGTRDYGWLQINSIWFNGTAYPTVAAFSAAAKTDPVQSAVGALVIYGHQGLEAWSTWRGSASATLALAQSRGNCTD